MNPNKLKNLKEGLPAKNQPLATLTRVTSYSVKNMTPFQMSAYRIMKVLMLMVNWFQMYSTLEQIQHLKKLHLLISTSLRNLHHLWRTPQRFTFRTTMKRWKILSLNKKLQLIMMLIMFKITQRSFTKVRSSNWSYKQ